MTRDGYIDTGIGESSIYDVDTYRDMYSSEYVYDVIYNHPERIQKIKPMLEKLDFIQNTHFVFTIIFDNFWRICEKRDNTYRYQIKRTLLNLTRDVLAEIHPKSVAATLIGTDKVVVLLECPNISEQEAEDYSYRCAEELQSRIMARTTFSISIGVSNYCSSPYLAWRAYEQSFQALSESFVFGYGKILKHRKTAPTETVWRQNEVTAIAKRFVVALTTADEVLCQQHVDHMFQRLSIITAEEAYAKSCVVVVLSEIVQYCIHLGMDPNWLSQQLVQMITEAFKAGTMGKLQESTSEFFRRIMLSQEKFGQIQDNPINVAHAYIEQFHQENITLRDLASLCGYSDAYFCRLFKKTYQQTHTQFLTQCRVEHAKQLLRESAASIAEIAEDVGFHSFSYFCVCFQKWSGEAPGEYRRRCKKGNGTAGE